MSRASVREITRPRPVPWRRWAGERSAQTFENFVQVLIFYSYAGVRYLELKRDYVLNRVNRVEVGAVRFPVGELSALPTRLTQSGAGAWGRPKSRRARFRQC